MRQALTRVGAFLEKLRSIAEQLTPLERWYRILSEAFIKYLKGRQLDPPSRNLNHSHGLKSRCSCQRPPEFNRRI